MLVYEKARVNKTLLPVFYRPFCHILLAPGLFLRVTCVVFARATNTNVSQAIVACYYVNGKLLNFDGYTHSISRRLEVTEK